MTNNFPFLVNGEQKFWIFSKSRFFGHSNYFLLTPLRPNQISNMGGVITIWGKDFAADNFNQFEPDLGNKVMNSSIPSVKRGL